jgi:hypothetical protein
MIVSWRASSRTSMSTTEGTVGARPFSVGRREFRSALLVMLGGAWAAFAAETEYESVAVLEPENCDE